MIEVCLLGTGGMMPLVNRFLTSLFISVGLSEPEILFFGDDCFSRFISLASSPCKYCLQEEQVFPIYLRCQHERHLCCRSLAQSA